MIVEESVLQNEAVLKGAIADFGTDFHWGISSSAYQTEGAYLADGKGPSIWDEFSNGKGKIAGNHNGNVACDFYNRFEEDLHILKELGIKKFRFSLSWPRLIPDGVGQVNSLGLAFYNRLIDACLNLGIEPWVTLYHWDLPLALEQKGGWANRDMINWFREYAYLCANEFGDRVKNWMVLNEPLVFTGAGYFFGIHAPGRKSLNDFIAAVHHATLCQAEGGRILRETIPDANIGTTISCSHITPKNNSRRHQNAARKVDALLNRLFIEPALGLGYPTQDLKNLNIIEKFMKPGDEYLMQFDFDFWGIQNYTREIVKYSLFTPIINAKIIPAEKRTNDITAMNWEIYPDGLYELLMKYSQYRGVNSIVITENGAAFEDQRQGSIVKDLHRINYLRSHLKSVRKAKERGAKVDGYFVWTFLDNFEWAEGFRPRFGLIYVDFKTQQRVIKQSALWYSEYLNT